MEGLLDRLARLRAPAQREKPATVYCVAPGKRGAGREHLAVELKRCGVSRVWLVGADCLAASVGFLLKHRFEGGRRKESAPSPTICFVEQ